MRTAYLGARARDGARVAFELIVAGMLESTLAVDAKRGLARAPRSLPPKHLYDAKGCALFDRICDLPEYYLTRAEQLLLARHAEEIATRANAAALLEIGSGMARKTRLLLAAMSRRSRPVYVPFDISREALAASAKAVLCELPGVRVRGVLGDFTRDIPTFCAAAAPDGGPRLFAFLGSTIGNLDEHEAPALLREVRDQMTERDHFLLGADLVKDHCLLSAAYNDRAGVTAAFNKNLLATANRELWADFDLDAFTHYAPYVRDKARIEMHLRARSPQSVRLARIGLRIDLEEGETIRTEISRKFTRASLEETLTQSGMQLDAWYSGADRAFALVLARRG